MKRSNSTHIFFGILVLLFSVILYWKSNSRRGDSPPPPDSTPASVKKDPATRILDFDVPDENPSGEDPPDRSKLRTWIEQFGRATVLRDNRTRLRLKQSAPKIDRSDLPWLFSLLSDPLYLSAGTAELLKMYRLPEAIGPLVRMIQGSATLSAKGVAIEALAVIGGDSAGEALIRLLSTHSDTGIRARAATALGRFHGPEAHRALVDALRSESNSIVRRYIGAALQQLSSPEMVEVLLATMPNEPDATVVAELAIATYQSGGESALPRIREILNRRPAARQKLQDWIDLQEGNWYRNEYPKNFFDSDQQPVPFYPRQSRIGITLDQGSSGFPGSIAPLFRTSPLDRYRDFFYLRLEKEWLEDLASGTRSPRAYRVDGSPIPGGMPINDLDGTVHLRFVAGKEFSPGILGFTEGNKAAVTSTSLLHEFGHALAELADEYNHELAKNAGGANVDFPDEEPKWDPLIRQGHLGNPVSRRDRVIPSNNCYMNNHPSDNRWCPVCQLALIAKICRLSDAPVPW